MAHAVAIFGADKNYDGVAILDGLCMRVPQGTIYGLLGASGCGKSTLLSCLVGRKKFDSGTAYVLGRRLGFHDSNSLSSRIGYMPQDVALVGELSIKNCAQYFGQIYGMKKEEIEDKFAMYEKLLDLPNSETFVKNLSGGEMRRASLAVTLLHEPQLLILDEPTVGLDPVLRQNIWDHLLTVASEGKTVIITTHYIEEATHAHFVGLMRNGKLLEEGAPDALKIKYQRDSLEQVFLTLCVGQDENRNVTVRPQTMKHSEAVEEPDNSDQRWNEPLKYKSTSLGRLSALIWKNVLRIIRHPGGLAFTFILPLLEIMTFFLTIGGVPRNLRFGVVNEELSTGVLCPLKGALEASHPNRYHVNSDSFILTNETTYSDDKVAAYPLDCDFKQLSCAFIDDFHQHLDAQLEFTATLEEALASAKRGHLVGVIHFSQFFTPALLDRLAQGRETDNETLQQSHISIWLDMSDGQTGFLLQQHLYSVYERLVSTVLKGCGTDPRVGRVPVNYMPPVYGIAESSYGSYIAPGVLVTLIFFLAVTVTSIIIIVERDEGVWGRTLVAGVSTSEVLISHVVTQGAVMIFQTIELVFVSFVLFHLRCEGSLFDLTFLLLVQGLCGMCAGFSISVWCDSVTASNFISMGSFVPIIFLSGSLWPLEGMPTFLRCFSLCMPTTLATEAVRNILEKGWRLSHSQVILGCVSTFIWIAILMIFSGVLLKYKKP